MKTNALRAVLGLTLTFLLVPGSASGQGSEEPGSTVRIERACESATHSRILVIGSGFAPNELLETGLVVVQDNQLVFLVEGALFRASADGTFELPAEWEGPATYSVQIARQTFPPSFPFFSESLFVDCSKPATKQECKEAGWRAFGFKNQGQCVASVQRAVRQPA